MIIAIVAAAIVLLAAVGGIIMVLTRGGTDQPDVTITPSQPVPPAEEPTQAPTEQPTPEPQPSPREPSEPPTRGAVDLGNGIELVPAAGWEVKKTGQNVAQLSNGTSVFLGQSLQIEQSTNPGQLCDAWHHRIAEDTTNGKFQDAKDAEVGTTRLKAATCTAQVTVSGGQGSTKLFLFSLVSVRQSDGVTVIGTTYFTADAETDQLNKDFTSMINSMLRSQAAGG
jgi:pyruvate/2-oxoglutarate dehydrogenase complex dihydrolipoamide acyltransferase (E2) component